MPCGSATVWTQELWQYTQCAASLFCPGAQPCLNQSDRPNSHTLCQHLEKEMCSLFMKIRHIQTANTADVHVYFSEWLKCAGEVESRSHTQSLQSLFYFICSVFLDTENTNSFIVYWNYIIPLWNWKAFSGRSLKGMLWTVLLSIWTFSIDYKQKNHYKWT